MRRNVMLLAAVAALAVPAAFAQGSYPDSISLPDGFRPEGIAIKGNTFYVGSIPTGAIYRGSLRTGQGAVFIPGATGRAATGLKYSRGRLYVSGAATGKAFVYDARTGQLLKEYQLGTAQTFVNDVVVTRDAAYFTESQRGVIYRVPTDLGPAQTITLSGDYQHVAGQFNLNGIDATPNGKLLVAVQSVTGKLFTIDPVTGATNEIEGVTTPRGDGILLHGKRLYVVQNTLNTIAVLRLDSRLTRATLERTITPVVKDPKEFPVPTTIARHGSRLWAVNARFGLPTEALATADFNIVQVKR